MYYFADKSGSVAHLVDNEIPLSTSSSSVAALHNSQRLFRQQGPPPPIPVVSHPDDRCVVSNNNSNNDVQIHHPASSRSMLRPNFTENVYNNVPPVVSRLQPMPGPLKPQMMALELIKNDPSLHVYSNIEEKMHESIDIFLKSGPSGNRYGAGGAVIDSDNDSNENINENLEMDDDLDDVDDDVMTVSDHEDIESSFIHPMQAHSPPLSSSMTHTHNLHSSNSVSNINNNNNNTSTSSSSVTTQIDTTHLSGFTPVLKSGAGGGNNTKFQPSTMALTSQNNNNMLSNVTNSISTSSSVGNASDLDGASSIGNNSQSCLVKPAAIV